MARRPFRSDTDPGALADYIIALLKHEKPPTELKAFCISQLVDFLHDSTCCAVAREQLFGILTLVNGR